MGCVVVNIAVNTDTRVVGCLLETPVREIVFVMMILVTKSKKFQ